MRTRLDLEVVITAPAAAVWDYVTDWPRQGEWMPFTRVEHVHETAGLGARFRAWTGMGPLGFWDPITVTAWERTPDGGGRCEILHLGRVVKGEGEFVVVAVDGHTTRFVWAEMLVVPFGRAGALGWRFARPVVEFFFMLALRRMRDRVESTVQQPGRTSG